MYSNYEEKDPLSVKLIDDHFEWHTSDAIILHE